jgi:hypothetical protein
MKNRFEVEFLQEVIDFFEQVEEKARDKIIFNIHKVGELMMNIYLKRYLMKFGNSEPFITESNIDYLLFGIKQAM